MAARYDAIRISLIHTFRDFRMTLADMDFNPAWCYIGFNLVDVSVQCFGINISTEKNGLIVGMQNQPPCVAYSTLGKVTYVIIR